MVEQANRCRDILASLTAEDTKDPVISRLPLGHCSKKRCWRLGQATKNCMFRACLIKRRGPVPEVLRQPELIYGIGNLIANAV